eukprot:1158760-Pelagomonas_calceolata.AAC.1
MQASQELPTPIRTLASIALLCGGGKQQYFLGCASCRAHAVLHAHDQNPRELCDHRHREVLHAVLHAYDRNSRELRDHCHGEVLEVPVAANGGGVVLDLDVAKKVHTHDGPQVHEQQQHNSHVVHSRHGPVQGRG